MLFVKRCIAVQSHSVPIYEYGIKTMNRFNKKLNFNNLAVSVFCKLNAIFLYAIKITRKQKRETITNKQNNARLLLVLQLFTNPPAMSSHDSMHRKYYWVNAAQKFLKGLVSFFNLSN